MRCAACSWAPTSAAARRGCDDAADLDGEPDAGHRGHRRVVHRDGHHRRGHHRGRPDRRGHHPWGRLGPPARARTRGTGAGTHRGASRAAGDAPGVLGAGAPQLARRGRDGLARGRDRRTPARGRRDGSTAGEPDPGRWPEQLAGAPAGAPTGGAAGRGGAVAAAEAAAGRRMSTSSVLGRGGGCSLPLEVKTRRGGVGAAVGAGATLTTGSAGATAAAGSTRSGPEPSGAAGGPRPAEPGGHRRSRLGRRRRFGGGTGGRLGHLGRLGLGLGRLLLRLGRLLVADEAFAARPCDGRGRPGRHPTLEECDLTPIPSDSQRSSVSLLVSPSSRASSYRGCFQPRAVLSSFLRSGRRHEGPPAGCRCLGGCRPGAGARQSPGPLSSHAEPTRRSEMVGYRRRAGWRRRGLVARRRGPP